MPTSHGANYTWPESVHRLQLGAANISAVMRSLPKTLFNESWLHFGDYDEQLMHPAMLAHMRDGCFRLTRAAAASGTRSLVTYFVPYWYQCEAVLPFADNRLTCIFSEHFFEHLFLNEACELFKECFRVLRPAGAMRVVVPDADLRTYEPIEPAGLSMAGMLWTDPGKHKSRWSIYSLEYILRWIGFRTHGVVYCDRFGRYHLRTDQAVHHFYDGCAERQLLGSYQYVSRLSNSLVVDAIKP